MNEDRLTSSDDTCTRGSKLYVVYFLSICLEIEYIATYIRPGTLKRIIFDNGAIERNNLHRIMENQKRSCYIGG